MLSNKLTQLTGLLDQVQDLRKRFLAAAEVHEIKDLLLKVFEETNVATMVIDWNELVGFSHFDQVFPDTGSTVVDWTTPVLPSFTGDGTAAPIGTVSAEPYPWLADFWSSYSK